MVISEDHLPREERRRRTELAILAAAQQSFAEAGFDRTTIRGVAARAGIDPALVMQYFGSKEGLFAASARWSKDGERVWTAARDEVAPAALADLFERFEPGASYESAAALMRNCLTHPTAARLMRDDVMRERQAALAETLGGEDADLRAALIGACMMGLAMARYLVRAEPLAGADRAEVERLMLPALRALVDPPATPETPSQG